MPRLSEQDLAAVEAGIARGWAGPETARLVAAYRAAVAALERIAAAPPGWCVPIQVDGLGADSCDSCAELIETARAALRDGGAAGRDG